MKKIPGNTFITVIDVISVLLLMQSCVDHDFDAPDPIEIPVGEVHNISDIRQMFSENDQQPIRFTEDASIYGVITMDGTSGNIYRSAYLQDNESAINLRIMSPGGLYQGDSVRINLKGTTLSAYEQMLQLDSVHTGNNVVKLATQIEKQPIETDLSTLLTDNSYQAKLIKLNNVEFRAQDMGKTFADAENLETVNRFLRDCSGNEIIVRTSGYSNFADSVLPAGNGSIVAIMAQFRDEKQLYIRNIDELMMENDRCAEQNNADIISIEEIRQGFLEGWQQIPAGKTIEGVIISDIENENTAGRNAFIQDDSGYGIAMRFADTHSLQLNDKVQISVGTVELSQFNGLLQINNLPTGNAEVIATNVPPTPVRATINEITTNMEKFESTLV
ncbi:MAG: DUF5689 domain-containing protein, partial [Bacteroidota bacterium]